MHQKLTYWDKSTRLIKPLNIPILAKSSVVAGKLDEGHSAPSTVGGE